MAKADGNATGTSAKVAKMTAESLPIAIAALLEMNNYSVSHDVHIHGAQVDLLAKSKGDPFAPVLYIEATIEYVSTAKYGKDATKFLLVKAKDPGGVCLCISSTGFTADVSERASASGVQTLTYDELFKRFEKFGDYVDLVIKDAGTKQLAAAYEEPQFNDPKGQQFATKWLGHWKQFSSKEAKWLIILGEYGTGKTSLTKILQRRWIEEYHDDPSKALPIRIELRNFSRQFDARGLLHHFLDSNNLSHISIEFILHLIRTGRAVLLLDGYDEMAQFLNSRERRACLKALADLASDGAKGLITSRPNYFTENEELNVFEALYTNLEQNRYYISQADRSFIDDERAVDQLVERYVLSRYERSLQDLTPQQTESLVRRKLSRDPKGQEIILSILRRVFREEDNGQRQALSGKPVIISYLLELVDELRKDETATSIETYSEWQLYKMILDRLMLRDAARTSLAAPLRRKSLQSLSLALSARGVGVADEAVFTKIIDEQFRSELRRLTADERRSKRDELFEELRSSATLTRTTGGGKDGYLFSHNSLREYLVTETLMAGLATREPAIVRVPITAAMRSFVTSMSPDEGKVLVRALSDLWPQRSSGLSLGPYLVLLWDWMRRHTPSARSALLEVTSLGQAVSHLSDLSVRGLDLGADLHGDTLSVRADESEFSQTSFSGINLQGSHFRSCVFDEVDFSDCNLRDVNFSSSIIFETNFSNTQLLGSDFRSVDLDINIKVTGHSRAEEVLVGTSALGWLRFHGALTDNIDDIYVLSNHSKFPIISKISEKLSTNTNNQLLGLTQRGVASADPRCARSFVDRLLALNWATIDKNNLVTATGSGRSALLPLLDAERMAPEIAEFLREQ